MPRPVDDLDGVWKKCSNRVERLDSAFGVAGKIQDQRCAADSGDTAGENGTGRVFQALAAHLFRQAWDYAVSDSLRGFGSGIAGAEAGTTSGEDEVDTVVVGEFAEQRLDLRRLVREKMRGGDGPVKLLAASGDGGAGGIIARTPSDGIADGDYGDVH